MPPRSTLRADLLAAARDALARDGYGALSVRGLARTLGVSPGAIYYHVDGQAGIYQAVVADGLGAIRDAVRAAYESTAEPAARVRAMARAYCAYGLDHPHSYYVVMMLREDGQPDVTEAQREPGREVVAMAALALGAMVADGAAPVPAAPELLALEAWAVLHGAVSLVVADRISTAYPGFDPTVLTEAAVGRVLQMVGGPPPAEGGR